MSSWTPKKIADFEIQRHRYLTEIEDPPSEPWDVLTEEQKVAYLKNLPKKVIAEEFQRLTSSAWDLGKRTNTRIFARQNGQLLMPKGMNGKSGYDLVRFREGDDLCAIVYNHYNAWVDPATYPEANYVSSDAILTKRREYLGPNPRVAGFRYNNEFCEIEWWEAYLERAWCGEDVWSVSAYFDKTVQWWFAADRSL